MKTHRTDGLSLTFAVLFCGVVAVWLLTAVADIGLPKAGWLVAGALILFGVVGLVGTLRSGRQTTQSDADREIDETVNQPGLDDRV